MHWYTSSIWLGFLFHFNKTVSLNYDNLVIFTFTYRNYHWGSCWGDLKDRIQCSNIWSLWGRGMGIDQGWMRQATTWSWGDWKFSLWPICIKYTIVASRKWSKIEAYQHTLVSLVRSIDNFTFHNTLINHPMTQLYTSHNPLLVSEFNP